MNHLHFNSIFILVALIADAVAAPPVEGDRDLLRLLIAAQETNASLYPSGRMQFRVRDAATIGTCEAEGTVVWDGPKIRWDYSARECGPREAGPKVTREEIETLERIVGQPRKIRRIEIPGGLMSYRPELGIAAVGTGTRPGAGYATLLEVCPHQGWYRIGGPYGPESSSWRRWLDPEQVPYTVTRFTVSKEPQDQVAVVIRFRGGDSLRILASLRCGGNVIEYETLLGAERRGRVPSRGIFWRQGSYDWAQNSNGEWYLKHMECRRSSTGDPTSLYMDFALDVDSFDPKAPINPSEFTLASLKLAPGTTVEETGKRKRTYRIAGGGKEKKGIDRDRLDALGESLRESGFAEPGRSEE